LRRLIAVLVLMAYVVGGALHSYCGLDVAVPSGESIVALVNSHAHDAQPDEDIVAGHHCHGCFSVSMPAPLGVAAPLKMQPRPVLSREIVRSGAEAGIDPPPPKFA
jgi:hypothetical protein